MNTKFRIEHIFAVGNKKHLKYFILAKCLELENNFSLSENSKLDGIAISNFLTQPRALDKDGNPRFDLFIFKLRFRKDYSSLTKDQIVTLYEE